VRGIFDGIVTMLITLGIAIGLACWGIFSLISWAFGGDGAIRSEHPIKPEIELVIVNNEVDTFYVYREQE